MAFMSSIERPLYSSFSVYALNQILLPLKLVIPQPVIRRIPLLKTNADIRTGVVLKAARGKLLDIGCGMNRLVAQYRKIDGDGVGVDVYPWPGIDLIVEDTSHLPYPDASFDTISFVACINHIPNRIDVLREARRLLKPGGQVLLTNLTPRLSRIWHAWAFWDTDQHERGMAEGEVWGFTHDQLVGLAARAGFELVARRLFSWGLNSLYVFRIAQTARGVEPGRGK
jgi:SAM-dependent methyltransferase